jgi:hypothetical protein
MDKEFKDFFQQIGNVKIVILYTIFAILFYTIIPKNILNHYYYIINPIMLFLCAFSFYKGTTYNYIENFNINYERVKMLILIFCFITITITFYNINPGGAAEKYFGYSMVLTIIIAVFAFLNFIIILALPSKEELTQQKIYFSSFGYGIIIFFIFLIVVINIESLSGNSSIVSFILNMLLVAVILGLIYKTINVKLPSGNSKKNGFFNLLFTTLLYIPCLLSNGFDWIAKLFVGEYNAANAGSILMLTIAITLFVLYFFTPSIFNSITTQGGTQLVNRPVYTDSLYNLGSYQDLNGSDEFDYQYAISCWIFIDAAGPNMNTNYNKYTSLLNFGNKPNILYNGKNHSFMITMQQKNLQDVTKNKITDFDSEGNRIIYINDNMLLQKWNNLIINYNGGTLDIFLNGELVKSSIEVVPYYTFENLTIGENNGIKGGICNVVYFRRALTSQNIYYIYNTVKDITPPILNDSNQTILVKENF